MNVLLLGGTGFIGTNLARELADRDHDVTALSRSPGDEEVPAGVETVQGDVTDYDSIAPAFEGQDAVVNLVALSPLFQPSGGNEAHERVHLGGTENAVRAAEEHGVERFVQLSALGADPDGPTAYIRAKGEAERVVRGGDVTEVIVRPSVVFGDGGEFVGFTSLLTPPYVTGLPGGGKTRFQPIWVGDLVPMIAEMVEDERHAGMAYELGGPEQLTLAEVATAIERSKGRSLRVLPIPMVLAKIGLTIGGALPLFPMGPDQYRSLQFDNTTASNDVEEFGYELEDLTTLSEYLESRGSGGTTTAGSATSSA